MHAVCRPLRKSVNTLGQAVLSGPGQIWSNVAPQIGSQRPAVSTVNVPSLEIADGVRIVDLRAAVSVPYVTTNKAMKTREFTRLDPDAIDTKWYVPGVGMVRDKGPDDELKLVSVKH